MDSITGNVLGTAEVETTIAEDGEVLNTVFVGTAQDDGRLWTEYGNFADSFDSGDGSNNHPYEIATAAQLARLSQQVCDEGKGKDKYYRLTANIDLSAHLWKPIGHDDQIFKGHLFGDHFTIHGMKIDMQGLKNKWFDLGLFGRMDAAQIFNVNLTGISIRGNQYENQSIQVGGIAGQAVNSEIINCAVQGDEIFIRFSYNGSGDSLAGIYAGGLVGRFNENIQSWGSNIEDCASYIGKITADTAKNITDIHVGGLVGQGGWAGSYGVRNSFALSDVGKATNAKIVGLGALVGFSNLNSNVSKNLYFLDVANFRPVGSYFHSAHEIETIMADKDRMKNQMKESLIFSGWKMSEDINNGFAFSGKMYTATFKNDINGSSTVHNVAYGYPMVMPPDPVVDDRTFLGWYDSNGILYKAGDIYMFSQGIELSATYGPLFKFVVTFDIQGGSGGNEKVTATSGEDMPDINVPTRTGYNFNGYFTEPGGLGTQYYDVYGNSVQKCDLTKDCTLFANWKSISCEVLLKNEGSSGDVISVTAEYDGSLPEIEPPTRPAYKFDGYFLYPHGEGTQYYDAEGMGTQKWDRCCDTALYAMWMENLEITITIDAPCTQTTFRDDNNYPLKAVAKVNCEISGVEFNGKWTKQVSPDQTEDVALALSDTEDGYAVQVFSVEQSGSYTFSIMPILDGVAFAPVKAEPIQLTLHQAPVSFIASNIEQDYDGTPKEATVAQTPGEKPVVYLYSVSYRRGDTKDITPIEAGEYEIWVCLENLNLKFSECSDDLREKHIDTLKIIQASSIIENPHWSGAEKNEERAIASWDTEGEATRYTVQLMKDGSPVALTDDMLPEGASLSNGSIITESNSVNLSKAITEAGDFSFMVARYLDSAEEYTVSPVLKALAEVEKAGWKDSMTLSWSAVEGADYYVVQLFNDGEPAMLDTSAGTNILKIIDAEQGLFKVIGAPEVNNQTLFMNVFGICTYNVLPGSDQHDHYVPINYEPTVSDIRP